MPTRPDRRNLRQMWQEISTAPFDRDLELAVLDAEGPHALVFACRRIVGGWMKTETRERIDVHPTHWREWHGRDLFDSHDAHDKAND
jgi:hypothetical protein